jgi:hypothetical protein
MKTEQKENFQRALMRIMSANAGRFGLRVEALQLYARDYGFAPTKEEVEEALEYLGDEANGLVRPVDKGQFHPHNRPWKLTAKGVNHLAEIGL